MGISELVSVWGVVYQREQRLNHSRRTLIWTGSRVFQIRRLMNTLEHVELNLLPVWANLYLKFTFSVHQLFFHFIKILYLIFNMLNWNKFLNVHFIVVFLWWLLQPILMPPGASRLWLYNYCLIGRPSPPGASRHKDPLG